MQSGSRSDRNVFQTAALKQNLVRLRRPGCKQPGPPSIFRINWCHPRDSTVEYMKNFILQGTHDGFSPFAER